MIIADKEKTGMLNTLKSGELEFVWTGFQLELHDCARNERLFIIPAGRVFLPDFAGNAVTDGPVFGQDSITWNYSGGDLDRGKVEIKTYERGFKVNAEFEPSVDVMMNRYNLLPADTGVLFYKLNNFKTLHATDAVWEDIALGWKEFAIDTYSKDWQFAPHPTGMLFVRNAARLLIGATCAPVGGYGLYIRGGASKISDFYLDYGSGEWGRKIKAGETWKAPEFMLAFDREDDTFRSWELFGKDLIKGGYIRDPATRTQPDWYREHYYCTWGDQGLLAGYIPDIDLKKQSEANPSIRGKSWLVLNEKFVLDAAAKILEQKLPIRTILIDGGWMRNTMDFRAPEDRWPDFRGMVDKLHAMGFKVMVWWTWSEIRDEGCEKAIGRHNTMLNGKLNCHKRWMADFSKKSTQEEYLKPLMRRLFSNEPGCYDLDGVKTDYQADKIHPELPAEDPAWRGEENYFLHLYALFTSEMRKYKPDAQHCGCAGNYFLAEYIDLNRTYDVGTDNWLEHENRAKMLMATAPGVLPVYDMVRRGIRANFNDWVCSARRLGVPVHVGNVNVMMDDAFAEPTPMTERDYALVCNLAYSVYKPPEIKNPQGEGAVKPRMRSFFHDARRLYTDLNWIDGKNSIIWKYMTEDPFGFDGKYDFPDSSKPRIIGEPRIFEAPGIRNFRDIGGWTGLPEGLVYRGSALFKLDSEPDGIASETRQIMERLGIVTELDLRGKWEAECAASPEYSNTLVKLEFQAFGMKKVHVPLSAYLKMFEEKELYADAMRAFADSANFPVYVHCAGGADRTGTVIFLLEALCGVSDADIDVDYELTSFATVFGLRCRLGFGPLIWHSMRDKFQKEIPGVTTQEKAENFCKDYLGLSEDEIHSIKKNMRTI